MGNCSSKKKVGYDELRDSVPGYLVGEQDFDLFYSLCTIETVGNLTFALHPSRTQMFYVVISGQVVVHLSSPKLPNVCATTFHAGDMIHFFNSPVLSVTPADHSHLRNGKVSLSLQFKGYTEKMGRVIGMDHAGWDTFLLYRKDSRRQVQSLLEMSLPAMIPTSRALYGLTSKQVRTSLRARVCFTTSH
jgi:hypothetical protein